MYKYYVSIKNKLLEEWNKKDIETQAWVLLFSHCPLLAAADHNRAVGSASVGHACRSLAGERSAFTGSCWSWEER